MKRLLATFLIAAGLLVAVPSPAHAEQAFVLVRLLPNGNEQVISSLDTTLSTSEAIEEFRHQLQNNARGRLFTNPGHRYVIYGPTEEDTPRTIDDRVWDSAVDQ